MATRHIVAMLLPAWGHTIGYLNAAIQMLSKDSGLVITIVQHNLVGAFPETFIFILFLTLCVQLRRRPQSWPGDRTTKHVFASSGWEIHG